MLMAAVCDMLQSKKSIASPMKCPCRAVTVPQRNCAWKRTVSSWPQYNDLLENLGSWFSRSLTHQTHIVLGKTYSVYTISTLNRILEPARPLSCSLANRIPIQVSFSSGGYYMLCHYSVEVHIPFTGSVVDTLLCIWAVALCCAAST